MNIENFYLDKLNRDLCIYLKIDFFNLQNKWMIAGFK